MSARRPRASAETATLAVRHAHELTIAASFDLVARYQISSVSAVSILFNVALAGLKELDAERALDYADACVQREAAPDAEAREAATAEVARAFKALCDVADLRGAKPKGRA